MITETYQLIDAVKKMYPVVQFFKNRYFPDGKCFHSDEVLIECKEGSRSVAPFVVPYVNGIPVEAQKYSAYKFNPPYIGPKTVITVQDVRNKAFGEDPNSPRSAASRQNELQAERMDDMRNATYRTMEKMCTDIIMTGQCMMKHYAKAEDIEKDKYQMISLQFYEKDFTNKYKLPKSWGAMTVKEKLIQIYNMTRELKSRGVRASDLVLGADVSTDLFGDADFLDYFDKKSVKYGEIDPAETPEGVTFNGTINVMGVYLNVFTYDEQYEDLDKTLKKFIPAGAIIMIQPAMGSTAYGPVDFVGEDGNVQSFAEKLVPRVLSDSKNNLISVSMFSRPVPYPKDWKGWLVADINDPVGIAYMGDGPMRVAVAGTEANAPEAEKQDESEHYMTEDELKSIQRKEAMMQYADKIGMTELTTSMTLDQMRAAILDYQDELEARDNNE